MQWVYNSLAGYLKVQKVIRMRNTLCWHRTHKYGSAILRTFLFWPKAEKRAQDPLNVPRDRNWVLEHSITITVLSKTKQTRNKQTKKARSKKQRNHSLTLKLLYQFFIFGKTSTIYWLIGSSKAGIWKCSFVFCLLCF